MESGQEEYQVIRIKKKRNSKIAELTMLAGIGGLGLAIGITIDDLANAIPFTSAIITGGISLASIASSIMLKLKSKMENQNEVKGKTR